MTTRWLNTVDIREVWQAAKRGEITVAALISAIAPKLRDFPRYLVDQLDGISDPDDFDVVWVKIYDWADANRVWIAT